MYSRVIVPLDGSEPSEQALHNARLDDSKLSEQALPYARLVGSSLSAPIELVEACHILTPAILDTSTRHMVELMLLRRQRKSEEYLTGVRDRLSADGNAASIATLRGAPADAIVAHAGADARALVVMTTHGRGGLAPWLLGSVTDKVLHSITNPLLIVRSVAGLPEMRRVREKTVLAPLDGSARAELALPHVVAMANALGASISLLRITPTTDYYRELLADKQPERDGINRGISAEAQANADAEAVKEYLSEVKARLGAGRRRQITTDHLQSLNVAQAIMDRASQQPSLVVMASHGLGEVGRAAVGSITGRVVRHVAAPVLIIR